MLLRNIHGCGLGVVFQQPARLENTARVAALLAILSLASSAAYPQTRVLCRSASFKTALEKVIADAEDHFPSLVGKPLSKDDEYYSAKITLPGFRRCRFGGGHTSLHYECVLTSGRHWTTAMESSWKSLVKRVQAATGKTPGAPRRVGLFRERSHEGSSVKFGNSSDEVNVDCLLIPRVDEWFVELWISSPTRH